MQRSHTSPGGTASPDAASRGSLGRGFVAGLAPLWPCALIVIVAVALAALARLLIAGQGFPTQQLAAGLIIVIGLLGAAVTYSVFCVRVLRRVKAWQLARQTAQANGALWGLVVVALIVLLPLLLAILIPQHPAPTLTP
ncbi:MAG: hypothetical protein ACHQ4H_04775 [Ktedonobacterales bacterium]|jgi:hypothetical protein